jgi:hypothetical protein
MNLSIFSLLSLLFAVTPVIAGTALTEAETKAVTPGDLGPATIDVSSYPENQKNAYQLFLQKCSQCHTPARAINSPWTENRQWDRFVHIMHSRSHGVLLKKDEFKTIIDFLTYDSKIRKKDQSAAFNASQEQLKKRFQEVQAEKERLRREPSAK